VTDENIKENLEDIADSLLKIGNIRGKKWLIKFIYNVKDL
jgi:hypothetical protein